MEILTVLISLTSSALWTKIYMEVGGPSRNLAFAVFLIAVAVISHSLNEAKYFQQWTESAVLVASVAAGVFWLVASFDIAEGRL